MFVFLCGSLTFLNTERRCCSGGVFELQTRWCRHCLQRECRRGYRWSVLPFPHYFSHSFGFNVFVMVFIDFVLVSVASVSGSQCLDASVPMSVHDGVDTAYFAKYLTSPGLLQLQLADGNFRRQVKKSFLYKQTGQLCRPVQSVWNIYIYTATDS